MGAACSLILVSAFSGWLITYLLDRCSMHRQTTENHRFEKAQRWRHGSIATGMVWLLLREVLRLIALAC